MSSAISVHALKLTIAYDGTNFWGSQKQAGVRTVQQELETALSRIGGEQTMTGFAGRTDRGVHAIGQVVRCEDCHPAWDTETYARAINAHLPHDISVGNVSKVPAAFHPRFDAVWREYRYRVWCGSDQPLTRHHVWRWQRLLDVDEMAEAARLLVGTHDLAAFTGGGEGVPWSSRACKVRGTTRTVYLCDVQRVEPWWGITGMDGAGIEIRMIADGFLPQLVRTVVGALTTIGMHKRPREWISELIALADRRNGPVTAPPHGLVLWRVGFGDDLPEPGPDGSQIRVTANAFAARG